MGAEIGRFPSVTVKVLPLPVFTIADVQRLRQSNDVVEYVNEHHDELVEKDCRVEERIKKGIAEQKAKGLYHEIDESVPVETRAARLKEKLRRKLAGNATGGTP